MVYLHSSRTVTKAEFGTRDWGITVKGLAILFVGEI